MPVTINIHGENAAQAVVELRALAQELEAPAPALSVVPASSTAQPAETSSAPVKPRGRPRKESSAPQSQQTPESPPPVAAASEKSPPPGSTPAVAPATTSPFDDPPAAEVTDAQMREALQKICLAKPGNDGLSIVAKIIKENGGYDRVRDIKADDRAKIYAAALKVA